MHNDKLLLFGHRGAAAEAPENTLSGFAHAWEVGVRCFETDVRLSADGQLVLMHDPDLIRTTGRPGRVSDFSAAELGGMNACQGFPDWPSQDGIPSLRQVLEIYHNKIIAWQLEIKTDLEALMEQVAGLLAAEIRWFNIIDRVTITSFEPRALQLMQSQVSGVACGLIADFRTPEELKLPIQLGCQNVCLPLASSTTRVAAAARTMGLQTTGWPGNRPDQLQTLLEWQVDSITSDYPSLALDYLARQAGPS